MQLSACHNILVFHVVACPFFQIDAGLMQLLPVLGLMTLESESAFILPATEKSILLAGHSEKITKVIKVCSTYLPMAVQSYF